MNGEDPRSKRRRVRGILSGVALAVVAAAMIAAVVLVVAGFVSNGGGHYDNTPLTSGRAYAADGHSFVPEVSEAYDNGQVQPLIDSRKIAVPTYEPRDIDVTGLEGCKTFHSKVGPGDKFRVVQTGPVAVTVRINADGIQVCRPHTEEAEVEHTDVVVQRVG